MKTYPDSHEAQLAQRDLDRAPAWALETPVPGEVRTAAGESGEPVRAAPREVSAPAAGPQQ